MKVRLLTLDDRDRAKALWQNTFDDPPAFVDWYFKNRYLPEWSAGAFEGRELVSVVHGTPMSLSLGDGSFPTLMTSGVATVLSARGQGHMYAVMRFLQEEAERRGVNALFNHPQRQGAYAHLGFRPITFTKYWQGKGELSPGRISPFDEDKAFRVYAALADRYTAYARRDRGSFHLKMEDYAADGAKRYLLEEAGEAVGYAIYFEKAGIYGEEVLSLKGYGSILHEMKRIAGHRPVCAKLPPDADAPGEVHPQNVMLAQDSIWQAIKASKRTCFCVDEY